MSSSNDIISALLILSQVHLDTDKYPTENKIRGAYFSVESEEENKMEREDFYLTIQAQGQKQIAALVKSRHCVVFGYRKWKMIGDIRDYDMDIYKHIGVNGF